MGMQALGPKKLRDLNALSGVEWDRALVSNHSNPWLARCRVLVGDGCRHALVDRRTGIFKWLEDPTHFSSCPAWVNR